MSNSLIVPGTAAIVNRDDPVECAQALRDLRGFETQIRDAKADLTAALVEHATRLGSATIVIPDVGKAVVTGGTEKTYDAEAIEDGLRAAGMPENRISEIVVVTVDRKVNATEAKRAAAANPEYAKVIDAHTTERDKARYVTFK